MITSSWRTAAAFKGRTSWLPGHGPSSRWLRAKKPGACLGPSGALGELVPCWAPGAELGTPGSLKNRLPSEVRGLHRPAIQLMASFVFRLMLRRGQVSKEHLGCTATATMAGTGAYRCCCLYSNLHRMQTDCLCILFTLECFVRPLAEDDEEDLLTPQHSLMRFCKHS